MENEIAVVLRTGVEKMVENPSEPLTSFSRLNNKIDKDRRIQKKKLS